MKRLPESGNLFFLLKSNYITNNTTMKKYAIGVDIGGSHISCAVIDLEKGNIIRESFATHEVDNQASADDILTNWTIALKKSLSYINKDQLAGIGFAMPGPFDYENGIAMFTESVAKYQNLYSIKVSKRLKELRSEENTSELHSTQY